MSRASEIVYWFHLNLFTFPPQEIAHFLAQSTRIANKHSNSIIARISENQQDLEINVSSLIWISSWPSSQRPLLWVPSLWDLGVCWVRGELLQKGLLMNDHPKTTLLRFRHMWWSNSLTPFLMPVFCTKVEFVQFRIAGSEKPLWTFNLGHSSYLTQMSLTINRITHSEIRKALKKFMLMGDEVTITGLKWPKAHKACPKTTSN